MKFFLITLIFMTLGRKLGWIVSRLLYEAPRWICVAIVVGWGIGVAFSIHGLIAWLRPGVVLRTIMGYALGGYVSVPNFGLFDESSIPEDKLPRHNLVLRLPLLVYAVSSLYFALIT